MKRGHWAWAMLDQHFDNLPVRPEPLVGESLPGYLWRVLNLNGHGYLDTPFAGTMDQRQWSMRHRLMAFFGVDRLTPLFEAELEQMRLLEAFEGNGWQLNSNTCRPCPVCLRSTGAFMARQLLPLVSVCVDHGCWLMHRCPACQDSLLWRYIKLNWKCRCGAALSAVVTPQAPAWVIRLAHWVQSGTGRWLAGGLGNLHLNDARYTRPPPFLNEPSRYFAASMNAKLDQAFLVAIDHGPGVTSARRLAKTTRHWDYPFESSHHLLTRAETAVVGYVAEDALGGYQSVADLGDEARA
jgi:hypothetical protein